MTIYRPRNPVVHARHRREVLLQIVIPMLVTLVVLMAVGFLAMRTPSASASLWADISLIWIILPAMLFTLVGLALFGALAIAIYKLVDLLPYQFYRLQKLVDKVQHGAVKASEKITEPVLRIKMFRAGARALVEQMWPAREDKR